MIARRAAAGSDGCNAFYPPWLNDVDKGIIAESLIEPFPIVAVSLSIRTLTGQMLKTGHSIC
jgi:hypothetical protein